MIYINLNCIESLKYLHYSAFMTFETENILQVFQHLLIYFTVS